MKPQTITEQKKKFYLQNFLFCIGFGYIQSWEGKLKHEDSIWMKTIILGEKCRVPDEEEGAIIYEGKGKRISA